MKYKIIQGNCLEKLKELPENSVDSIVTDPPYELGFMGKSWDNTGIANNKEMWAECLRVLSPGGYLLSFGGTRTYHRMAVAIEDAGFEVRDMIEWVYGSGFPKSLNIGKAVDKLGGQSLSWFIDYILQVADEKGISRKELTMLFPSKNGNPTGWLWNKQKTQGITLEQYHKIKEFLQLPFADISECEREVIGRGKAGLTAGTIANFAGEKEFDLTKGTSEWEGWGTALKPAHEPICMARKPLAEKTVAENVLKYGCGGINIDASRVLNDLPESDDSNACTNLFHKDDQKNHKQSIDHQDESASQPLSENDQISIPSLGGQSSCKLPDCQGDCSVCRGQYDEQSRLSEVGDQVSVQAQNDARKSHDHLLSKQPCNHDLSNSYSKSINIDRQSQGRFPANLILDNSEEVRECFPESTSGAKKANQENYNHEGKEFVATLGASVNEYQASSGNASRFFKSIIYQAKASKSERNKGCEGLEEKPIALNTGEAHNVATLGRETKYTNNHPTVKPIALMEYLIKMVTPKGGIVLDPFMGSGSTCVAAKQNNFQYIGIEKEPEYIKIAEERIRNTPEKLL